MNEQNKYLHIKNYNFSKSFSEKDTFKIESKNYGIKDIIDYTITIIVSSYIILPTKVDYKLLIKGYKIVNMTYVADDPCGKIYNKKFSNQFLNMLPLDCIVDLKNVSTEIIFSELTCASEYELTLNLIYTLNFQSTITYYSSPYFNEWRKILSCDSYSTNRDECKSNKWMDPYYTNNYKNNTTRCNNISYNSKNTRNKFR